jgi:hypothetical protein
MNWIFVPTAIALITYRYWPMPLWLVPTAPDAIATRLLVAIIIGAVAVGGGNRWQRS